MNPHPGTKAWYEQVQEPILEPEREIIDPHHHLWFGGGVPDYLLEDLWADTGSGHKVVKTVFIECGVGYRDSGPEHLQSLGETEFAAGVAARSAQGGPGKAVIAGIVAYIDLSMGSILEEMIAAHRAASGGLLCGVRHGGARHPFPEEAVAPGMAPEGLFLDATFQENVRRLGRLGYPYESWHYHTQLADFYRLARAAPETVIVLDHFGMPLGTRSFRDQRAALLTQWKVDIARLAECPNVYAKLGGLAQPDIGFGWHEAARPASSDELVAVQKDFYLHTLECFGASRCMFESNFPVDKQSISYRVLWNAFKKMVANFSEAEKRLLFHDTAARVYRL